MNEFFTCIVSKNGLAYLTGAVIFFLTLFLTSRRIIGFTLTLLFLVFALIASLAVANQELIRSYFVKTSNEKSSEGLYKSDSSQGQAAQSKPKEDINADLQKAFDDLKAEFLVEKARLQKIWEDFNSHLKQTEKSNTEKTTPSQPPAEKKQEL